MKDQKHVYICSPLRPVSTDPILRANELIDNLKLAKDACTFAALCGCEPIAPHLYYPQFLDDNDPTERALGMELGLKALRICDPCDNSGCQVSIIHKICILKENRYGYQENYYN